MKCLSLTLRKAVEANQEGERKTDIADTKKTLYGWYSVTNQKRAEKSARSEFLLLIILFSSFLQSTSLWCLHELASSVTTQNNSWYATISLEKTTIWWKTRDEINIRRYPYREAHYSHIHSPLLLFDVLIAVAVACSRLRDSRVRWNEKARTRK